MGPHAVVIPEVSATITSKWAKGAGGPAGDELQNCVLAFDMAHGDDPARLTGDKTNTLQARMGTGGNQVPCVMAFQPGNLMRGIGARPNAESSPTLCSDMQGDQFPHVSIGLAVRRLTPVECERLQGFPSGWTGGFADSVRYRMLGNAVTVNVAEWLARRMEP